MITSESQYTNGAALLATVLILGGCSPAPSERPLTATEVWDRCIYVHQGGTVSSMRQCLVTEHGWTPMHAERQITLFRDSLTRYWDSVYDVPPDSIWQSLEREFPHVYGPMRRKVQADLTAKAVNAVLSD